MKVDGEHLQKANNKQNRNIVYVVHMWLRPLEDLECSADNTFVQEIGWKMIH